MEGEKEYIEEEEMAGRGKLLSNDPVLRLNLKYGNVVEDPQEKSHNKYKLNLGAGKDKNYLNINMPLENAGEEPSSDFHPFKPS